MILSDGTKVVCSLTENTTGILGVPIWAMENVKYFGYIIAYDYSDNTYLVRVYEHNDEIWVHKDDVIPVARCV